MATVEASSLVFNVNTGTVATPTWTAIAKVESFSDSPSKTEDETTNIDSAGWEEHTVTRRGMEFTLDGIVEDDAGTRDPGQEAVEALADQVGAAAEGHFQIVSTAGNLSREFMASVDANLYESDKNKVLRFTYKLKVTGAVTVS